MIKGRPPRLTPVFQTYDAPLFFVTACTLYRMPFPSLPIAFEAFGRYATAAQSFNIAVGRYVIMPDHLHLFVCGAHDFVLGEWVKGLKRGISNAFRSASAPLRWQPGFFDHLVRNDESYGQKWSYVHENPMRAGLVGNADEWPYQGEIVSIDRA
ncbi:MAG TPA: transposase [Chthoniobacterales bacterium]|nr:transposase [Chthoniobacterales bacterium]